MVYFKVIIDSLENQGFQYSDKKELDHFGSLSIRMFYPRIISKTNSTSISSNQNLNIFNFPLKIFIIILVGISYQQSHTFSLLADKYFIREFEKLIYRIMNIPYSVKNYFYYSIKLGKNFFLTNYKLHSIAFLTNFFCFSEKNN